MWSDLLDPGCLALIAGGRRDLRVFHQELVHCAVHAGPGVVLWCDGDHGCDPYDFGELNLERGLPAEQGADRVLVKRCMTPFQWDSVLTRHLDQKLLGTEAALVLVAPFDRLFSTDELADWEQEDYTCHALRHLRGLARRHHVPVVLSVDMARWFRTHPFLAQATAEAVHAKWRIDAHGGAWRARRDDGHTVSPRHGVTLQDFMEAPPQRVLSPLPAPRKRPPRAQR